MAAWTVTMTFDIPDGEAEDEDEATDAAIRQFINGGVSDVTFDVEERA